MSGPEASGETAVADRPKLADRLSAIFDGEPPVGDGVEAVYRRAEAIRKRRLHAVIGAGVGAVLLVAAVGYGLTAAVLPRTTPRTGGTAAAVVPATPVDGVLQVLRSVTTGRDLRIVPREPDRGPGWRQYSVARSDSGRPSGLIEVSVYAAPDRLCFPVLADPQACARAEQRGDNLEYVRYTDGRDADWQVNEVIARRLSDGRVIVVMATGERGTGSANAGRPPLTGAQAAAAATDPRLVDAFEPGEKCNGPDPACPVLKVAVPVED